jgi:hypothetical protein
MVAPITAVAIAAGIAVAAMTLAMLWFVWDAMDDEAHALTDTDDADGNGGNGA